MKDKVKRILLWKALPIFSTLPWWCLLQPVCNHLRKPCEASWDLKGHFSCGVHWMFKSDTVAPDQESAYDKLQVRTTWLKNSSSFSFAVFGLPQRISSFHFSLSSASSSVTLTNCTSSFITSRGLSFFLLPHSAPFNIQLISPNLLHLLSFFLSSRTSIMVVPLTCSFSVLSILILCSPTSRVSGLMPYRKAGLPIFL